MVVRLGLVGLASMGLEKSFRMGWLGLNYVRRWLG